MTTVLAGGRPLELLAGKAAFVADERALLVADLHIGKATTFRSFGVPVPRGTTSETLDALDALVDARQARRVVFLGDFLHSARARAAATLDSLARWRAARPGLELVLVRGNHDARAGDPPASLGIEVVTEPYRRFGLALCHHPRPHAGAYALAGHWHPCTSVARSWERVRLPCFWLGERVGVLPAFGAFTGMQPIEPRTGDRVYAVAGDSVVEVPPCRAERSEAPRRFGRVRPTASFGPPDPSLRSG